MTEQRIGPERQVDYQLLLVLDHQGHIGHGSEGEQLPLIHEEHFAFLLGAGNLLPDLVEDLDEAAHVGPLEMVKETHVHVDRRGDRS